MTVLVVGATGQLGIAAVRAFARDCHVVSPSRAHLDLADHDAVMRVVRRSSPEVVINCAAYHQVDAAESNPVDAMQVNGFGVRSLAQATRECGAVFVHYGSDFVFDGNADTPYDESVVPEPQSVYATSKLLGDWFACAAPQGYVLRVESLFGGGAETVPLGGRQLGSTLDRMVDAMLAGKPVRGVTDRTVSPSYVPDVVAATRALLDGGAKPGLYHCVNGGQATWFDVAAAAADRLGCRSQLSPIVMADLSMLAPRPKFGALSNRKLAEAGVSLPTWEDALDRYLTLRMGHRH